MEDGQSLFNEMGPLGISLVPVDFLQWWEAERGGRTVTNINTKDQECVDVSLRVLDFVRSNEADQKYRPSICPWLPSCQIPTEIKRGWPSAVVNSRAMCGTVSVERGLDRTAASPRQSCRGGLAWRGWGGWDSISRPILWMWLIMGKGRGSPGCRQKNRQQGIASTFHTKGGCRLRWSLLPHSL